MLEHIEKLGKQTIVYGIARGVTALGPLVLVPVLTRSFSPAEYGVVEIALVLISFLTSLFMLGFDSALAVYFYQTKDDGEKKRIISTALYFLLVSSFGIALGLSLFARPLSQIIFRESGFSMVLLVAFWAAFLMLFYNFFGNIKRLQLKPSHYLYLVAGHITLLLGLTIFFLSQTSLGVVGVIWAYLLASLGAALVGFVFTFSEYLFTFSRQALVSLLKFGFPLIFVAITDWILYMGDRLFLVYFADIEQVGLYSLGVRISQMVLLVVGSFQLAWGPFALSLHKEEGAKQTFARVLTYFTLLTCALSLLLAVFAPEIISIVSTASYGEAFRVVGILSLGAVASGTYYIVALGVNIAHKTMHMAWTSGLAALLNIGLNLILVPRFGMVGASLATVCSLAVAALLLYLVSQHYYPIPFQTKKVGVIWAITILLMMAGMNIQFDSAALTIAIKLIIPVSFGMILFLLGVLQKREIFLLLPLLKRIFSRP